MLDKKPFQNYTLDSDNKKRADIITLRLNDEERYLLEQDKKFLMMDRDGTVIKALISAGRKVLHDEKTIGFFRLFLKRKANKEEIDL